MLLTCQAGYETFLAGELALSGLVVSSRGAGWVASAEAGNRALLGDVAFAHFSLLDPVEIAGDSVNGLAQKVAGFFLGNLQGERVDAAWPCLWLGPAEVVGLGRRISSVEAAFHELLRKKLSRVAKLASPTRPRGLGPVRGLFVYFTGFGSAFVAREGFAHGQSRMADDDLAPSRSYLKVEEAFIVLGQAPQAGQTVVDLGAAPGGWSFSAAKRGAYVIAIDNGPLKGGALDHPRIEHRREDAFTFVAPSGTVYDWLFCDLVEEPHNVLRNIIEPWLARGWCRQFVINLKFGRVDPLGLMGELRAPGSSLAKYAPGFRIRHLYHDREELTVAGEVNGLMQGGSLTHRLEGFRRAR